MLRETCMLPLQMVQITQFTPSQHHAGFRRENCHLGAQAGECHYMAWCPNVVGSRKMWATFFTQKKTGNFFHPTPRAFPSEPLKGGGPPTPPRTPLPGVPPKKGVAPPPAKKREKRAILGPQYAKNGVFGAKNGHFRGIFDRFLTKVKTEPGAMQGKKGPSWGDVRCAKTRQFIQY
jgi:hypothetical protein